MRRATVTGLGVLILACFSHAVFASGQVDAEGGRIRQLISDWAGAWSSGSFNAYAGYYVEGFSGDFPSNAAWRDSRRGRVDGRRDIRVDIGPLLVRFDVEDPGKAQAVFVQSYRSQTWCDVVDKTLDLQRTESGWRISNEQSRTRTRC